MTNLAEHELLEQQLQQSQKQFWINQAMHPNTPQEQHQYLQNLTLAAQAQHQQMLTNLIMSQHLFTQQKLMNPLQFSTQQAFSSQLFHQLHMPDRTTLNLPATPQVELLASPTPITPYGYLFQQYQDHPFFQKGTQTPQKSMEETQLLPFQDVNQMNQNTIQQTEQMCSMEQYLASFQQHHNFSVVPGDLQRREQVDQHGVDLHSMTVGIGPTEPPIPSESIDMETLKSVFGADIREMEYVPRSKIIYIHDMLVLASNIQETHSFDNVEEMGYLSNLDLLNRVKVIANAVNPALDIVKALTDYIIQPEEENHLLATIFSFPTTKRKTSMFSEEDGFLTPTSLPSVILDPTTSGSLCKEKSCNSQNDCVAAISSVEQALREAHVGETPEPYREVVIGELGQLGENRTKALMEGEPLLKIVEFRIDSLLPPISPVQQVVRNTNVQGFSHHDLSKLHSSQETPGLDKKLGYAESFTNEQNEDVDVFIEKEPLLRRIRLTTDDPIQMPAPEVNPPIESSSTADQNRLEDVEETIQADQVNLTPTNENLPTIPEVRLLTTPAPIPPYDYLFQQYQDHPFFQKETQTLQTSMEETQLLPFQDGDQVNQDIVQQAEQMCSMEQNLASFQLLQSFSAVPENSQREEQIDQRNVDLHSVTVGIEQTAPLNLPESIDMQTLKSVFGDNIRGIENVPKSKIINIHNMLVLASKARETHTFNYIENMGDLSNLDLLNRVKVIANTINPSLDIVQTLSDYIIHPEKENHLMTTVFLFPSGKEKTPILSEEDDFRTPTSTPSVISDPMTSDSFCKKKPCNSQNDCVADMSSVEQAMREAHVFETPAPYREVVSGELEQLGESQTKAPMEGEPLRKKVRFTIDSLVPSASSVEQMATNTNVQGSFNPDLSEVHRFQEIAELNKEIGSAESFTERLTTDDLIQVPAPEVNPVIESSSSADQSRLEGAEETLQANQVDLTPTNQDNTLQGHTRVPKTQNLLIARLREKIETLPEDLQHKYKQVICLMVTEFSKENSPKKASEFFDMLTDLCKKKKALIPPQI